MTFVEKERECERVFETEGPFWHVYTDGSIMIDLFSSEDEMKEGMIALAVCSVLFRVRVFSAHNFSVAVTTRGFATRFDSSLSFRRR